MKNKKRQSFYNKTVFNFFSCTQRSLLIVFLLTFSSFSPFDFGNFTTRFWRGEDSENPRKMSSKTVLISSKSGGKIAKIEL